MPAMALHPFAMGPASLFDYNPYGLEQMLLRHEARNRVAVALVVTQQRLERDRKTRTLSHIAFGEDPAASRCANSSNSSSLEPKRRIIV